MTKATQMECSDPSCGFKAPENLVTIDQVIETIEIHATTRHGAQGIKQDPPKGGGEERNNMKISKCSVWTANQTYEAFARDLKNWRACSNL